MFVNLVLCKELVHCHSQSVNVNLVVSWFVTCLSGNSAICEALVGNHMFIRNRQWDSGKRRVVVCFFCPEIQQYVKSWLVAACS